MVTQEVRGYVWRHFWLSQLHGARDLAWIEPRDTVNPLCVRSAQPMPYLLPSVCTATGETPWPLWFKAGPGPILGSRTRLLAPQHLQQVVTAGMAASADPSGPPVAPGLDCETAGALLSCLLLCAHAGQHAWYTVGAQ